MLNALELSNSVHSKPLTKVSPEPWTLVWNWNMLRGGGCTMQLSASLLIVQCHFVGTNVWAKALWGKESGSFLVVLWLNCQQRQLEAIYNMFKCEKVTFPVKDSLTYFIEEAYFFTGMTWFYWREYKNGTATVLQDNDVIDFLLSLKCLSCNGITRPLMVPTS